MGDTSIIIAFLIGLGMFLFIMSFAVMQYDRATKRSAFSKNLHDEWSARCTAIITTAYSSRYPRTATRSTASTSTAR